VAATASPAAVQTARLAVTAHADSDSGSGALVVGSTVGYTFAVANQGGRTTAATLVDPLPSQVALIQAEADQGSCTGAVRVTCSLGAIAPGQTVTVVVVVQVTAATAFENPISVTGDPGVQVEAPVGVLTLTAGGATPVAFAARPGAKAAAKIKSKRKVAAKATARSRSKAPSEPKARTRTAGRAASSKTVSGKTVARHG